ncbi:MAG: hypothetical protein Q7K54_00625 [Candidatus Parcubacteria bacterium]|nr:hypothetical protein [Candidatus Parcubacteria bacterium]
MKNEKFICLFLLLFLFLIPLRDSVFAQSNYVLPYPSSMPGNWSYRMHLIYENVSKYWYFGDFGQFDYNLKMTDKYLVEAKTLLEYKQYLLGYKALEKSNYYFPITLLNLNKAKNNNKDIFQKKIILNQAALRHIETLEKMDADTPDVFNWQPEKEIPTKLDIKKIIKNAIKVRENLL